MTYEELLEEAKNRGFVFGAVFNGSEGSDRHKDITIGVDNIIKPYYKNNKTKQVIGIFCGNSWIFHPEKGWGTIVEPGIVVKKPKKLLNDIDKLLKELNESF